MTGRGPGTKEASGRPAPAAERPAMDPRIRQRRTEVVRRRGRRRLRVLVTALSVVTAGVLALVVLHSSLLSARRVTVVGAVHTPAAAVIAAAGLAGHPPLVDVGPGAASGVEQLPWVRRATVDVQWPDAVRITVVERTAVAAVPAGSGWALLDRTGRVLADAASPPAGVPQLAGSAGAAGPPGTTVAGDGAALRVAATLPKAFAAQVTQVDQLAGGQVDLHLTSPLTVHLGTVSQLHQKYEDVAAILSGASLKSGEVIDVSVPGSPVVQSAA